MTNKISNIVEELKTLTLLEAVELVKEIEKVFEIDTSIMVGGPVVSSAVNGLAAAAAAPTEVAEEKTSFDVVLTEVPADKKIAILKVVRSVTGLGLKESKEIVDTIPKLVKEGVTKEESENIKKEVEAAGGKVTIK
jgi:large subunit ribosomal protein L7/L12